MMENTELWNKLNQPPTWALKPITAGRLKGKSDINPQWRLLALTEQFGPCGEGWKYTIDNVWTVPAPGDQAFAFALVSLYVKNGEKWSDPIPGIGGSMLVVQEKSGPHANDEAYKMAVTDAISVACKSLGVAADIYMGLWDGSKYRVIPTQKGNPKPDDISIKKSELAALMKGKGYTGANAKKLFDFINPKTQTEIQAFIDTFDFIYEIFPFAEIIGLPEIQKVLRLEFNQKEYWDIPENQREDFLKALTIKVDEAA